MLLILLRHGIAHDRLDPACPPDFERALTEKGRRRTRAAVAGLRALGVAVDVVGSSPLVRAVQTAEIARQVLEPTDATRLELDALEPFGDPREVLADVAEAGRDAVLLAGHAPSLDRVVAAAVGAPRPLTHLKKAGVACLELEPGGGRLVWLHEPRALRRIASAASID